MVLIDQLVDFLGEYLEAGGGEEFRFCCPLCVLRGESPDRRHRLYCNPTKNKYFCHNCQAGGTLSQLARKYSIALEQDETLSDWNLRVEKFKHPEVPKLEELANPTVPPFQRLQPGSSVAQYLQTRGVGLDLAQLYAVGEGLAFLQDRAFFPNYSLLNGVAQLDYWVARTILPGVEPRYCNAPTPRNPHLYMSEVVEPYQDAILLTEGVLSCILAGRDRVNSTASYGKYVTRQQITKLTNISKKNNCSVVVCLDGDAVWECLNVASRLLMAGVSTQVMRLPPDEDPASLDWREFNELFEKRQDYTCRTELSILGEWKL